MNILVLLSGLSGLLELWGMTGASALNGDAVNRLYFFLIPLFINLSLSSLLAQKKELDSIGSLLISMVCFFQISGFLAIDASAQIISSHDSILTSIPSSIIAIHLLSYFSKMQQLQFIKRPSGLSPRLTKSLNLIIPALLTLLCFEFAGRVFNLLENSGFVAFIMQALPRFSSMDDIQELILYKAIALITWFLGIHGEHSAEGVFRLLNNSPIGASGGIHLKTFHDVFLNIGGAGSTFVIPFLLLLKNESRQYQSIARLALPFSFFNVNEILLFGLPIIWNPIFLIPFLITPFVNMVIGLFAIKLGLFSIELTPISWMSPPLYSAYVASHGSGWAVWTHAICIVIDGFIYYPFLMFVNQQFKTPDYLKQLFDEDAYTFVTEEINIREERLFVAKQMDALDCMNLAQQVLNQLRGGEFILFFQPKIGLQSGKLVGLEALIRFENPSGDILSPSFLPILHQQGLSKAVDKKVISLVFQQVQQWQSEGFLFPPISINLDKDFLLDTTAVNLFLARAQEQDIFFCLEITEYTYTTEMDALASVVRDIRKAGHRIAIDDFGAGYSSLTTLVVLDIDEIKLDRRLVIPPLEEEQRGQMLLRSSVQLCHELGFSVVAEGVETRSQMQLVQDCGVDVVQGYYTGKPMHPKQVSRLFQAGS